MIRKYGIWFLIIFFGLLYSFYSVIRHLRFESFLFDLGVYDQIIWLVSRGKPLYSSILESHPWGDHFTPILILLAPLYWIWDNVIILLLFQASFAAFGAYPIYLLARKKTQDTRLSLIIAFSYLASFGVQNAISFDFHPIVLAATLLSWLFWLYEEKKYKLFGLIFILFLGLQENFFLLGAALGLFLAIHYKDFKRGLVIAVGSFIGFLFVIFGAIPYFGKAPFIYLPVHLKDLTLLEYGKLLFYPLVKVKVMIISLLSFAFLPLGTPAILILLFEEFFQRFVGNPMETRWGLGYQYNVILAPILAYGAILTIEKFFPKRRRIIGGVLMTSLFFVQISCQPALNNLLKKEFYDLGKTKNSREILKILPRDASVAATNNLGAQIAHREKIIFLTNCRDNPTVWLIDMRRCFSLRPDYLVADLSPDGHPNNFYPDNSRESLLKYIDDVQRLGEYQLIKREGDAFLLKKR